MAKLKQLTDFFIYVGILVVVISIGTLVRKRQKHDHDISLRQLGLKDDVQSLREVRPIVKVVGPMRNNSTGNLALSLRTDLRSPWKVINHNKAPSRPITINLDECNSAGWPECDSMMNYISTGTSSNMTVFIVQFKIENDDLITFSGAFRSNCPDLAVYMSDDNGSVWKNIPAKLQHGQKLDSLENPGPITLGAATSATTLHYSIPLQAGFHFVGLVLTAQRPTQITLWFDGALSGTIAENIMAV